jgi:hypothetical protein
VLERVVHLKLDWRVRSGQEKPLGIVSRVAVGGVDLAKVFQKGEIADAISMREVVVDDGLSDPQDFLHCIRIKLNSRNSLASTLASKQAVRGCLPHPLGWPSVSAQVETSASSEVAGRKSSLF